MNKLFLATSILLGTLSWGQNSTTKQSADGGVGRFEDTLAEESYKHGINFGAGMSVGQPVFAVDYEYHLSNHFGIGAYGSYAAHKGVSRPGVGSIGADFKAHISLHSIDIYVRPGLGMAYFDDGTDRTTFLAPVFATGVAIRVMRQIAVGMEHIQTFNWTSDNVVGKAESLVASVQFRF